MFYAVIEVYGMFLYLLALVLWAMIYVEGYKIRYCVTCLNSSKRHGVLKRLLLFTATWQSRQFSWNLNSIVFTHSCLKIVDHLLGPFIVLKSLRPVQIFSCHPISYKPFRRNNGNKIWLLVQWNLNISNTDTSFTMVDSNSFLSHYEILLIGEGKKYLRIFFLISSWDCMLSVLIRIASSRQF